ncbi:MAG: carbonic anhydrase [Candidatus Korobacteraceae bacterium]
MKSQEALARIIKGVSTFQTEVYPAQRSKFESLKRGQEPLALFIGCADSRVVPSLITQTGPGEIFIEQNPGNLVPHYGEFVGGVSAGVEYAMLVLKVPLVIICGHSDCGVMKAVLHPEKAHGLPAMQEWMRHVSEARHRTLRDHASASDEEKLRLLTEYNVLAQIENLKSHPSVHSRILSGEAEVRGWVYDIGDGSIWAADPESGRFEIIGGAPAS